MNQYANTGILYKISTSLRGTRRGGPGTFRRPGMPHGMFEKWIRRYRLLRLSSQLSAWRRDDLCKHRGDRQGKRERRALGMDTELWNERTDNLRSLSAQSTLGDSNATLALKNGANVNTSELSFSPDCQCLQISYIQYNELELLIWSWFKWASNSGTYCCLLSASLLPSKKWIVQPKI